MNADQRKELATIARSLAYACEQANGFQDQQAAGLRDLRYFLYQLEQPESSAEDEDRNIDPIAECQRLDGMIAEVGALVASKWQSHGRQHDQLDAQIAEVTERLDRTLRSLAVKQPLPEPSGEEEVEPKLRAAFNQIDANGKVLNAVCVTANVNVKQLANHAEQLAHHHGVLEGMDKRFTNLSDGIDTNVQHVTTKLAKLAERMDNLYKEPTGATLICRKLNEHAIAIAAADKELGKLDKRMDEHIASPRVADWHTPPKPEPACEHPDDKCAGRSMLSLDVLVSIWACECGAYRLGGFWYIPQPSSEVAFGSEI